MSQDKRTMAGRFYSHFDENLFDLWHRTGQASVHAYFISMVQSCQKLATRFLNGRVDKRKKSYLNLMAVEAELNSALLRYQEALDAVYDENYRRESK